MAREQPAQPVAEEVLTPPASAPENHPPPEEVWQKFLKSRTANEAASCLALLPQAPETGARLGQYVRGRLAPFPQVTWGRSYIDRIAAAIGAWEPWLDYGSDDTGFLEQAVANHAMPVLIRDSALRVVVGAAHRKKGQAADADAAAALSADWQTHLEKFLTETAFGDETSIGGLALQAALFASNEKIAPIDPAFFDRRIRAVIDDRENVNEFTLAASLDVAAQRDMPPDVAGAIREIVGKPQSEAVQLAGLRALARNGSREDVAWLETVPARTPVAHRALLDAQRVLQEKPEN